MVKYKTILKIINETVKTHDGTSLGKVRNNLNRFARKYNQLDHEEASIYNADGKEIKHLTQNESDQVDLNKITEQLDNEGVTGCHIDHNHPILHYADVIPSPLSIPDMDMLRIKNKNGDYIYQSISCESKNGYRMTLIKNKNFNEQDEKLFQIETSHFNESCNDYYEAFRKHSKDWSHAHAKEYHEKGYTLEEFRKESIKQTISELGTFEDFIFHERGYDKAFKNCNCKLRITRTQ